MALTKVTYTMIEGEVANVLDFGAVGDGVADDTAAILAAIATNKTVFFPEGLYKHTGITINSTNNRVQLQGAGRSKSRLICNTAGADSIRINNTGAFYSTPVIRDLWIDGNGTNGCGIFANGVALYTFETLNITGQGSHGILLTDTGTAASGSYIGTIRNVYSSGNIGDGIRQVATSGADQQNASWIMNCELQGNANGLTLWGFGITVRDCSSEGNTGWGVYFDNGLTSGLYSATNLAIKNCYFEANTAGHIGGRVGNFGVISNLEITGSLFNSDTSVTGTGYVPVKFTNYSSIVNAIRSLNFRNNEYSIQGTDLTTYADFDDAPSSSCQIVPTYGSSTTFAQLTNVPAKYINIGLSPFTFINSLVLNGYFFAKGGSGITYSNIAGSDNITVTGSSTNFPVQVPIGSSLTFFSIPVESDCPNYTINMYLRSTAFNNTDLVTTPPVTIFATGTGVNSQLVTSQAIIAYASPSVTTANSQMVLLVQVIFPVAGTFFRLGAPTIYYVAP
jgi:hypothetical protein